MNVNSNSPEDQPIDETGAPMQPDAAAESDAAVAASAPVIGGEPVDTEDNDGEPELDPAVAAVIELEQKFRNGANWFYWVAALSLINTVLVLFGPDMYFVVGMGITLIIDSIAVEVGTGTAKGVALLLDVLIYSFVVLFGFMANRKQGWVFIVGGILYALDSLFFIFTAQIFAVLFHAWVLFCLFSGYAALRKLKTLDRQLMQTNPELQTDAQNSQQATGDEWAT